MTWPWNRLRQPARFVAVGSLGLCLVLAGCGDDDDDDDPDTVGLTEESPVIGNLAESSPGAGRGTVVSLGRPEDANTETVTITEDGLDPETITGQAGLPFVLVVEGDGEEHVIEIENLVSDEPIAAEGATEVLFSIPEDVVGDFDINLDDEQVGTFTAQAPGGLTD